MPFDCKLDKENKRVIFVVKKEDKEKAVGERGLNIQFLNGLFRMRVEIIGFEEEPTNFIKEALFPNGRAEEVIREVRLVERGGRKVAYVIVEPSFKALAIGRGGRNVRKVRELVRKYFGISNVVIV